MTHRNVGSARGFVDWPKRTHRRVGNALWRCAAEAGRFRPGRAKRFVISQ